MSMQHSDMHDTPIPARTHVRCMSIVAYGVVDEDVDAAVLLQHRLGQEVNGRRVAHVGGHDIDLAGLALQLRCQLQHSGYIVAFMTGHQSLTADNCSRNTLWLRVDCHCPGGRAGVHGAGAIPHTDDYTGSILHVLSPGCVIGQHSTFSRSLWERATRMRLACSEANFSAIVHPTPREAPVMSAHLPFSISPRAVSPTLEYSSSPPCTHHQRLRVASSCGGGRDVAWATVSSIADMPVHMAFGMCCMPGGA
jgi:hypothetical protein